VLVLDAAYFVLVLSITRTRTQRSGTRTRTTRNCLTDSADFEHEYEHVPERV
jgi:hypothetical protein